MNKFFQKDSANYEQKINRIIEALEAEAAYLRQLNEKMDKLSDEWQAIKRSLQDCINNDMQGNLSTGDFDTAKDVRNGTTEKEIEELILCIVKEINNHHIEFVCLN